MILDEMFIEALMKLDPQSKIPDEDNYVNKSRQYKAPDHSLFDGLLLVERKTRNTVDDGQFYNKINSIASAQGTGVYILGKASASQVINQLPNANEAMQLFANYFMNQTKKTIVKCRKKFEDYSLHVPCEEAIKILILSDQSKIGGANDAIAYWVGAMMGATENDQNIAGCLDAIVYAQHPEFVWDRDNSYWFCSLVRDQGTSKTIKTQKIIEALHNILCKNPEIAAFLPKFKVGKFKHILV